MGLLLSVSALADPPSRLEGAVANLFAALPSMLDSLWVALTKIPWVAAVVLGLAVVARRRWALARDLVVSAAVATLLLWVAGRVAPLGARGVGLLLRRGSRSPVRVFRPCVRTGPGGILGR